MSRRTRWILPVSLAALLSAGVALVWPIPASWTEPEEHRRVVDRHGQVLLERRVPHRGRALWVELHDVAPVVVDALLAAEDHRFQSHPGVDPIAVARATRANWRAGRVVQGGSTLTQQAARLMAGRPPGLFGKGVEAWRALRIDAQLGKDQILVQVLNRSWFGAGAAGIEAAANEIFGERASGLSTSEAATLVGLLPAPERLDPRRDRQAARNARDRVIDRMVQTGRLDEERASRARSEPLQLARPPRPGLAPHLATRLLGERDDTVIETTLDAALQREVESVVRDKIAALEHREVDHAAVVVVHAPSSEIRAWVGSADWSASDGQNDGVLARRSPGSALKPFVYGIAFENGMRPGDVLPDLPARYDTPHGTWAPGNYSGGSRGPVRAREALASSLNLPAVHLLEQVGVSTLYRRLEAAGVEMTAPAGTYGLGLALGDAEISLADLAEAITGLARGGLSRPLRLHPEDPLAQDLRFMDRDAVRMVQDVLSDPQARIPGFGRYGVLERPYDAAVKTGTSQGFRDNWTVGWAGDWVVAVWVGNFDARPMGDVSGVTGAAPIWAAVMDGLVLEERPRWSLPEDWEIHTVCGLSGDGATPRCPHAVDERLPPGRAERPACGWHTEQGIAWPSQYAAWAAERGAEPYDSGVVGAGVPAITWPSSGAELYVDPRIPLEHRGIGLRATAPAGASIARWSVDGELLGEVGPPFHIRWPDPSAGRHRIGLVVDGRPADEVVVDIR